MRVLFMTAMLMIASGAAPAWAVDLDRETTFAIDSQPLSSALVDFSHQTQIQVMSSDSQLAERQTAGLKGRYTIRDALGRLLAGTDLDYSSVGPNTIKVTARSSEPAASGRRGDSAASGAMAPISLAQSAASHSDAAARDREADGSARQSPDQRESGSELEEVVVTGTHIPVIIGKTLTPIRELPQSIFVVTRQQMDAQMPQEVNEVLRYTPGIYPEAYGTNSNNQAQNSLLLRGFPASGFLDGLRDDDLGGIIDPHLLERVEVMGGPASVLYGQTTPGGIVNLVSKTPADAPIHQLELGVGNHRRVAGAFDLGGRLDGDGRFLYRLTGVGFGEDTQTDFVKRRTAAIAPAFTWRLDEDTSLTVLGKYIYNPNVGAYDALPVRGTLLPNPNGRIPLDTFTGDLGFYDSDQTIRSISYVFDHRFSEAWQVRQNLRFSHLQASYNFLYIGDLEPDLMTADRYLYDGRVGADSFAVDTQLLGKFASGALSHTLLFGVDYKRYSSAFDFAFDFENIPSINIFAPDHRQDIPLDALDSPEQYDEVQRQVGPYVQDQISLGKWRFLVGARLDFARDRAVYTDASGAGSPSGQTDRAFTWRVGATYLFDNGMVPYASYSTAFKPELGSTFSGKAFVPTKGAQAELGVKYQAPGSGSFLTAAVYNLTERNVLTPDLDPTHPGYSVQSGEIRVRGFELQGHARPTDNLDLSATYTYSDAINTRSNLFGTTLDGESEPVQGKHPVQIPQQMLSLWADYTVHVGALSGLGLGGGARRVGATYGDDVNSLRVPAFTLYDAMVHYDFGRSGSLHGLSLQLNAVNLLDKSYLASCQGQFCFAGLRRAVYATLRYSW